MLWRAGGDDGEKDSKGPMRDNRGAVAAELASSGLGEESHARLWYGG